MKSLFETTTVVAAVGVFLLLGLPSEAQEAKPNPQVPELEPLQRFIGTWELELVLKPAEGTPEKKTSVTSKVAWILDGRMLQIKSAWSSSDIEALGLMTYDAADKVYRMWIFDSTGYIPREEVKGTWDEATKTFTWKGSSPSGNTSTHTHRFIGDDTHE